MNINLRSFFILLAITVLSGCSSSSNNNAANDTPIDDTPIDDTPIDDTPIDNTPIGNGGTGTLTGNATQVGTLTAEHDSFNDETGVIGGFYRLNGSVPASRLDDEVIPVGLDTCTVRDNSNIPDFEFDLSNLNFDSLPTAIRAGEFITLSSPAGTYATLAPGLIPIVNLIFYGGEESEVEIPGAIPAGLIVDIPGESGGFPAFSNVAMPGADPLDITSNGLAGPTVDISWTGSSSASSTVSLSLSLFLADDNSFSGSRNVNADCTLADDGNFTLPADLLGGSTLNLARATARRSDFRIYQKGTSLLLLQASTSLSFNL